MGVQPQTGGEHCNHILPLVLSICRACITAHACMGTHGCCLTRMGGIGAWHACGAIPHHLSSPILPPSPPLPFLRPHDISPLDHPSLPPPLLHPAVLVSLYEEPDKPKQALDYIKSTLGGPTPAEYEAVVAQRNSLQSQVRAAQGMHGLVRGDHVTFCAYACLKTTVYVCSETLPLPNPLITLSHLPACRWRSFPLTSRQYALS